MRSRWPSTRSRTLALLLLGLGMGAGPPLGQDASSDVAKSAKERLSDKASDDQRVDNCKVALNRRGAKIRPDTCSHDAAPSTKSPVREDAPDRR